MALKSITSLKSLLSEVGAPDRLTLLEPLGFGGQAEVWLARDQMLDRFVTVKKVPSLKSLEDGADDERLKSLRARAEMEHPAIPTLFGVIPHGDQSWLVSEYIEGIALSELLGELSPESIYAIAKDLLSALRGLERLSLVHGDLSPNNIVIDRNGQVRLLDFESCSRIGEELSSTSTIGFSAPERHARRAGLPTVDTWSVGAILIWLVTQRTPEVVFDDAKQPISVTIGPAIPATDLLGDVINIAAAATRVNPSLRPLTADLEERLSLSYRWLEPVNRSALEILVRSRLPSLSELDSEPLSYSGSVTHLKENQNGKRTAKSNLHPDNRVPWRNAQGWIKRARREDGRPVFSDSGWTRSVWNSIGSFRANWLSVDRVFSATFLRPVLSLGLAITVALFVSVINWNQQRYTVRVDTTRLSPATTLPIEFSPQWVESIFSSAIPDNWELISEVELSQKALSATSGPDGDQVDAELFDRGQSGELGVSDAVKVEAGANASRYTANDAVIEVIVSINCAQGICELLAERGEEGRSVLNHTVILDTRDARIWRSAITDLAKSITTG